MNKSVSIISESMRDIIGKSFPIISAHGHGVGTPVEKIVINQLKQKWPRNIYTCDEFCNRMVKKYPDDYETLFKSQMKRVQQYLILIRKDIIKKGGLIKPCQNATMDFITGDAEKGKKVLLGDVKAINEESKGGGNLISYGKVETMCQIMLEDNSFDSVDLLYIGVVYRTEEEIATISNVSVCDLFLEDPYTLKLNPAQRQIQGTVSDWKQDFDGDRKRWCQDFLNHLMLRKERWAKKNVRCD